MRRTALSIIVSTLLLSAASPAVAAPNLPETRQLSLAQALDLADRENPDLAGRRARIEQADAAARQALSAVLPIVKASANYTLNNQDAREPSVGPRLVGAVSAAPGGAAQREH